jgi:hypothetical protein
MAILNRNIFIGLWKMYSDRINVELLLNEDGSYGETFWGGVQHWGVWGLQDRFGQTVLVLQVQNGNPPQFLETLGQGPLVEYHAVLEAQPNLIMLYDAIMQRQFVPGSAAPKSTITAPTGQASGVANQYLLMPINRPSPAYSAPPPPPQPEAHNTPVLNQLNDMNGDMTKAVQASLVQTYKNHRQAEIDMENAKAAMDLAEFQARQQRLQDQADQMHKQMVAITDGMRAENALRRF